ncbi:hypothetical protein ACTFIZ_006871 [Dictyostelium cf. discoideum]
MSSILNNVNNITSQTKITYRLAPIEYEINEILVTGSDAIKYECVKCLTEIENKAFQCKNGHIACENCWEVIISARRMCMTCEIPISSITELPRNLFFEGEYSNWKQNRLVVCPYSKEKLLIPILPAINNENNSVQNLCCHGAMEYSELHNHIQVCESTILECNLCSINFYSKDTDKHQNECSMVYLKCEYCNIDVQRPSLLDHHKSNCKKYLIECNHCKMVIERETETKHLKEDCYEIMIPYTNRNDFPKIGKGINQQCSTLSCQFLTGYRREFIEFSFNGKNETLFKE